MSWANLEDTSERVLGKILLQQAEKDPDRIYIMADEDRYSFGQVNQLANSYAAGLSQEGVERGDTVAMLMESCPEFIFATFGVNKLGAIWVPTNTDYKGQWLRETLEDSVAKVLIVDAALLPRVAEVASGLQFEKVIVRGAPGGVDLGVPLIDIDEFANIAAEEPDQSDFDYGDTMAVLWTSGTTGRSKGVMQSHNAWIRATARGAWMSGVRDDDIHYSCLPLYNSGAWVTGVYRALFQRSGTYIHFSMEIMPPWEYAFAMTVHKSQGSEFEDVLLVLPEDETSRLLTREIIYTGITRAKKRVILYGSETAFHKALQRTIERQSGLTW